MTERFRVPISLELPRVFYDTSSRDFNGPPYWSCPISRLEIIAPISRKVLSIGKGTVEKIWGPEEIWRGGIYRNEDHSKSSLLIRYPEHYGYFSHIDSQLNVGNKVIPGQHIGIFTKEHLHLDLCNPDNPLELKPAYFERPD